MNADELRSVQAPLKERYCVVYQTLARPPVVAVTRKSDNA